MKRIISLLAVAATAASALLLSAAPAQAQEQNHKFWICIFGCPKTATTCVRLDAITSVSKHTYNVGSQTVREVTIDTTGNNSIRIYCMNVNEQQQRYKDRLSNTRELMDSKTGRNSKLPTKKFPEGTYSHNVEYQVEEVTVLDKIYDSVMNAIMKNKGCTLKV
ncbi:MAG: hypothetical protein Q4F38_00745 [Akkermansia sp.]|nr:hypothetical protein [Akkermansia sp.]